MTTALLFSVFVIASCGLAYELIAGALASYLLGDSVTQFSTVIGTYLFAMGIGSWLSKFIERGLITRFIQIELLVGLIGGYAAALLFLAFTFASDPFRLVLYFFVLMVGILVGLEIPLVMRILKRELAFRELVSQVLTFDYLGALAVSLLFPILLAPHLGLIRSGLLFGLLNALVAAWALYLFRTQLPRAGWLRAQCAIAVVLLAAGFAGAGKMSALAEQFLYTDEIIYAKTTHYQRIVVTRWHDDVRLFLNNNLQFSSRDEYRYHEALVHPALQTLPAARNVLVLGGGDGMAVREILKHPQIESVTLVDLDTAMTTLFRTSAMLTKLNGDSLNSPKVRIINDDALRWLEQHGESFDFIVVDFPDPSNYSLGKLYSTAFYRLLERHLRPQGLMVIQATSPLYARKSFWTIAATLDAVGLQTTAYHTLVPSFGEWGYVIAGRQRYAPPTEYTVPLRFLTPAITTTLFEFPIDMAPLKMEPNQLTSQNLVRIFEQEWKEQIR